MKKEKGLLALLMVMLLCVSLFAGCSSTTTNNSNDDDDTSTTAGTSDTDETEGTSDDTDTVEDVIGEVTYVGTSYLSVSTYTADDEVTDYAALDTSTLTADGSTKYIYPEDDATYYTVSDGTLVSATSDDVTEGCMIAVTTDDDGNQQIIVLTTTEDDDSTDNKDNTDVVAEVADVNDDGTLSLILFTLSEDASDYVISDYAAVELDKYCATETTEEYTIPDDCVISLAEDSVLTETTSDEIAVGDTLIIYTDEDGITNIAVYHAEEDTTA